MKESFHCPIEGTVRIFAYKMKKMKKKRLQNSSSNSRGSNSVPSVSPQVAVYTMICNWIVVICNIFECMFEYSRNNTKRVQVKFTLCQTTYVKHEKGLIQSQT
jgi:hypothetical protein